jgi:hypothetical protein
LSRKQTSVLIFQHTASTCMYRTTCLRPQFLLNSHISHVHKLLDQLPRSAQDSNRLNPRHREQQSAHKLLMSGLSVCELTKFSLIQVKHRGLKLSSVRRDLYYTSTGTGGVLRPFQSVNSSQCLSRPGQGREREK